MDNPFEIDQLQAGPGLDRLVGDTLMGTCTHEHLQTISYQGRYGWVAVLRCLDCDESPPFNQSSPPYSTDLNATYRVEEQVLELGLVEQYSKALHAEIAERTPGYFASNYSKDMDLFLVAHATPEQRCKAALKAFLLVKH